VLALFGWVGAAQAQDTTAPAPAQTAQAVWPYASSPTRYATPEAAALGFADDFLGMHDPHVCEVRQGDTRSGEIDIGPAGRPLSTGLLVRQLTADNSWWVLYAGVESIQVDVPGSGATISSPVNVAGRSSAFEGTVPIEVRQDGSTTPIGSGFVTGGAGPELGPFSGDIPFTRPSAPSGALVFLVLDYERGGVDGAVVQRVHFGPAPVTTTSTTSRDTTTTRAPTSTVPPVAVSPRYTG